MKRIFLNTVFHRLDTGENLYYVLEMKICPVMNYSLWDIKGEYRAESCKVGVEDDYRQ